MEKEIMDLLIISKEDFKTYFKSKRIIKKEEYHKYIEDKLNNLHQNYTKTKK